MFIRALDTFPLFCYVCFHDISLVLYIKYLSITPRMTPKCCSSSVKKGALPDNNFFVMFVQRYTTTLIVLGVMEA